MPDEVTALLALWNDVDPALDAAYNDWHAREHVPERCTVPGIVWGRRYARVGDAAPMPRYLTLYGLRDPQVLDSAPYQRLLREPTPASRAMRPALQNISRWVCRLHASEGAGHSSFLAVSTSAQRPAAPQSDDHLLGERVANAAPLPWLSGEQHRGIDGHWLLCVGRDDAALAAPGEAVLYARLAVG